MAVIAVLGCLDTKGAEFAYLIEAIRRRGHTPLVIDTGVMAAPPFEPDISAERVAAAGGIPLAELRSNANRGESIYTMSRGAAKIVNELYTQEQISAIIGMGGSGGTSIFVAAVQHLPIGFPKMLISTMAAGDTRHIVGKKDLLLVPSVVDISGLNRITRRVLTNAANAICGMAEAQGTPPAEDKPLIAASMLGNTTPAVETARHLFEAEGYEVLAFHAIGSGGQIMESLMGDGWFAGVFDITTTEIAAECLGSPMHAGPSRLRTAGRLGIPQVVAPGCLDFVIFRQEDTIPHQFLSRRFYRWNTETTLMRVTSEEAAALGRALAERVNLARGPVAVLLPLRGLSMLGKEGQPFWCPEADEALFRAIRRNLRPHIPLIEMDVDINHPSFAQRAAEVLLTLMSSAPLLADRPQDLP